MLADFCHVVLSCFRGEMAPRKTPPNGDLFVFSHGDLSPHHTKVRHFSCVSLRLLFVVTLPGGAKGRHAKTRKSPFGGFRAATFRVFAPVCRIFAWWGERSPRENPPNGDFVGFSPHHTKVRGES